MSQTRTYNGPEYRALTNPIRDEDGHALLSNPNRHYYPTRRSPKILLIGLHITAGVTDYVGPDSSAESTTRFGATTTRPVSWHVCIDSDSIIPGLPDSFTAWVQGVAGYNFNSPGLGLELGTGSTDWSTKPEAWVERILRLAAIWLAPRVLEYGIPLRLERDRDAAQALIDAGRPVGFMLHHDMDPANKTDPGLHQGRNTFPIETLFALIREELALISGDEMATTLNGSPVLRRKSDVPVWIPGPHSATQLEGYSGRDTADILMGLRWMQNADIRPITQLDAYRDPGFNEGLKKAGSMPSSRSNHMAAEADDADWSRNPFRRVRDAFLRQPHSFTKREQRIRRDHRFIARGDDGIPVVGFGSDFGDDMHNEIAYRHQRNRAVPDYRRRQAADRMRAVVVVPRTHEAVKAIQRTIGVTPDARFGKNSIAALRKWQRAHGIKATGWWTPESEAIVNGDQGDVESVLAKVGQADPELTAVVQEIVGATVDRKYGKGTASKVARQQGALNLAADGVFGPGTARAVLAKAGTLKVGSTGPAVILVQFIVGATVDGVYGENTAKRVAAKQKAAGITADGIFGSGSRKALVK